MRPPAGDHAADMAAHQGDRAAFARFDAAFAIPFRQACRFGEEGPDSFRRRGKAALEHARRFRRPCGPCSWLSFLQRRFQRVQPGIPEGADALHPVGQFRHAFRVRVHRCASALSARTCTSLAVLQGLEMLGDGGRRKLEAAGDVARRTARPPPASRRCAGGWDRPKRRSADAVMAIYLRIYLIKSIRK